MTAIEVETIMSSDLRLHDAHVMVSTMTELDRPQTSTLLNGYEEIMPPGQTRHSKMGLVDLLQKRLDLRTHTALVNPVG